MPKHNFEYDFVISYAGEDTIFAETLKEKLEEKDAKVFYAPDNVAQLWGIDLTESLAEIYSKKGLFCIPLISENYVKKQWTRHEWRSAQERALSDIDTTYILPVRLDSSDLPGLLGTTSFVSTKDYSIDEIVQFAIQKMDLFLENVALETPRKPNPDKVWEYVPQPNQRNTFLHENNYLNRKTLDFTRNDWTKRLFSKREDKYVDRYFTLFAIPIPEPKFFEIEEIIGSLQLQAGKICSNLSDEHEWQKFNIGEMRYHQSGQSEYVKYHYHEITSDELATSYLRFDEAGSIEYADSYNVGYFYERINTYTFNFISILGSTWKFLLMAKTIYSRLGYDGKFQLGINLFNTNRTALCNFASGRDSSKKWLSPCDNMYYIYRDDGNNEGITYDKNQQFIYNINPISLSSWNEEIERLIHHLSMKIQRSYNLEPKLRHLIPDTEEFPWHEFGYYSI